MRKKRHTPVVPGWVKCGLLVLSVLKPATAAEISGNLGFMSDYLVGGLYQTGSAAYTGIDIARGGVYAGTRLADLDEGIEYDLYAGYRRTFDNGFSAGVSAAGYFYSDEFDKTYTEQAVHLSYRWLAVDLVSGTWDGDLDPGTAGDQNADYTFAAVKVGDRVYAKYGGFGAFGGDFKGRYLALGYVKNVGDLLELGVKLVLPDHNLDLHATANARAEALADDPGREVSTMTDNDVYLAFDLNYRFDIEF